MNNNNSDETVTVTVAIPQTIGYEEVIQFDVTGATFESGEPVEVDFTALVSDTYGTPDANVQMLVFPQSDVGTIGADEQQRLAAFVEHRFLTEGRDAGSFERDVEAIQERFA